MKRKGASTSSLIGVLIVGLLIGAGIIYAAAPSLGLASTVTVGGGTSTTTTTKTVNAGLSGEIMLGDLVALTGSLSDQGARDKPAVDMAVADVNAYLTAAGITSYHFAVTHEDSATDVNTVQSAVQDLASKGIKVFIGPEWSGGALQILPYATTNHLVLISQSSTSAKLSYANRGPLFRVIPSDSAQGAALGRLATTLGFTHLVMLHVHDSYGDGLANATVARFTALGGIATNDVQWPENNNDFSSLLTTINNEVTAAINDAGGNSSKVAVDAIGFEEVATLMQQLGNTSAALSVTWLGSDGEATLSSFVQGATGPLSEQVKLISTVYAPPSTSVFSTFSSRYQAAYGQNPGGYGGSTYDAVWVAALSIIAAGSYDGAAVAKQVPLITNHMFGNSGWLGLDQFGDLIPVAYNIWVVHDVNGTATWVTAGQWAVATDAVTFTTTP
ncbi:MAG: ABC transporter substrate-binding protein [archaeon]|nr:MAG: ABC transporter substrate-binding protein [archaeon]